MTKERRLAIQVKRVYEKPARLDGCRILVDRIWPRGLSKDAAALDGWMKEVAPSAELRKWFGHEPSRWPAFKKRYFRELDRQDDLLERLLETCSGETMTLLFGAKDCEHNNAVALKEYLEGRRSSAR
ncbi:MAG: DUF488 domain-containing protein [Polyangiales bacterium]